MKTLSKISLSDRYVNLLSDVGFKVIFGDGRNADILTDLLNTILSPHGVHIHSISYAPTEYFGEDIDRRSIHLDLHCINYDGSDILVEVQLHHQANFFLRSFRYASRLFFSRTIHGRDPFAAIKPVYYIGILADDFRWDNQMDTWVDQYISRFSFREDSKLFCPLPEFSLNFVELNRFDKQIHECTAYMDKWCFALKNLGRVEKLPSELQSEIFEKLFDACEIERFTPQQKQEYEELMRTVDDYESIIYTAHLDGVAEGEARGEAKGRAEGRVEGRTEGHNEAMAKVVRNMKATNMPVADIATFTGLSLEEIAAL